MPGAVLSSLISHFTFLNNYVILFISISRADQRNIRFLHFCCAFFVFAFVVFALSLSPNEQELLFLLMLYFIIFSEEAFFWATFLKTYALLFAVLAWSSTLTFCRNTC